jgi:glycyl-tRNA synthetase (class II)
LSGLYDKLVDPKKRELDFMKNSGLAGFCDFGPVGVLLKRSIIDEWLNNVCLRVRLHG